MLKKMLGIALTPVMFTFRLLLGIAAFIVSISASLMSLCIGLFALLGAAEFLIGYWQNGIFCMVLALLVSPIGLPLIANAILNTMGNACSFIEGLLC